MSSKLFPIGVVVLVVLGLSKSTRNMGAFVPGDQREASAAEVTDRLAKVAERIVALERALNIEPPSGTTHGVSQKHQSTNHSSKQVVDIDAINNAIQQRTLHAKKSRVYRTDKKGRLVEASGGSCHLNDLQKLIHDAPEDRSLPQIFWQNNDGSGNEFLFPAFSQELLEEAFAGRLIAFIGDSTLFDTVQWVNRLIGEKVAISHNLIEKIAEQSLSGAYNAINAYFEDGTRASNLPTNDTTFITSIESVGVDAIKGKLIFAGFPGIDQDQNCEFLTTVFPKVIEERPSIIVANWGLHLLYQRSVRPCNVRHWIKYEDWLEQVMDTAVKSHARLLIFKTTNRICDTKDKDDSEMQQCLDRVTNWTMPGGELADLDKKSAKMYCEKGLMNDVSSAALNYRLWLFLRRLQRTDSFPEGLAIITLDDYGLQTCRYSSPDDGAHYHQLQLPTIRMLALLIQCWYFEHNRDVQSVGAID